jgi:hypothetical protein
MSNLRKHYITYGNQIFAVDVDALIKYCLVSEEKNIRDNEITEGYERLSEEDDVLTLTSRVIRENTGASNPQNDMITYDVVKMFLGVILSQSSDENPYTNISFAVAFNSLANLGFLIEITE